MPQRTNVLVVEDESAQRAAISRVISSLGYAPLPAEDGKAALASFTEPVAVALIDLHLPDVHGFDLMQRIREVSPSTECIVLTGDTATAARDARIAGASDYFHKPILDLQRFEQVVRRCVEVHGLRGRIQKLAPSVTQTGPIVGVSSALATVRKLVDQMASSHAPILITGESGTGKEVVADAIHRASRRTGPFVRINCAALPESLIEAELFGAVAGTYTGQKGSRDGLLTTAAHGTVFLDEIGEMPIALQPKLLRVLQSNRFMAVGGRTELELTARVISATNADLARAVRDGQFREDLYYRLRVLSIDVPPLRERADDVPVLLWHFVRDYCLAEGRPMPTIPAPVMDALVANPWPGNVRELANAVHRAIIVSRSDGLTLEDFGLIETVHARHPRVDNGGFESYGNLPYAAAKARVIEAFARWYLTRALDKSGGNITHAAAAVGLHRPNFRREMRRFGLDGDGDSDA